MDLKEIGGYQVIEMVGEGGQGSVYRAQDASTGQIVAIKVLSRSSSDGEFLDRFQREASIMATLRHPNVVEVYDHGEEDGQHYIVTEFVTENLERILERGGTLPLQRAITVVQQIASALQVSHNAGITHRDIKPANVLLNDAGDVKLTDFGIASAEQLDSMTSENTTVGTPLYMSPEQIQGSDAIDGRSDLYSLGCLLYEVLTGATPFSGKSTFEIFNGHINDAHVPIANHMDEFPEQLEDLLTKSLTKDRDQRYQTADEMINDLEEINTILTEGPQDVARTRVMPKVLATQVIGKPNTTGSRTTGGGGMPKWLMPAGAIVALLVIIGGGAFFFMGQDSGAVGLATGIAADISGENWAPGIIADPEGIQQAASDLSASYQDNPVSAVTGMNQLQDLDPALSGSVVVEIHSQNAALGAEFLLAVAAADPARLESLFASVTELDAPESGRIFNSLIAQDPAVVASLLKGAIQGSNSESFKTMFFEAAKNDYIPVSQLVNQAALTPGTEEAMANALISIANVDIEIAAEILGGTNTASSSIWSPFISIEPTKAGTVFVTAYKNGYEGEVTEKIINILPDIYVSGLLLSHMAREDAYETARVYASLMDNPDAGPGSMGPTIVEAARFDYVAVEKMLIEDSSFFSQFAQFVHPQIWTTMELPMAGDGEEGKGIWTKPSLDASSLIDFSSIVVKSLNASDIESGTVGIFDVTPPVSDTRPDRNVLTHVQVDTEGFTDNGLTTILVFDVPKSHFVVNETGFAEGHPWSVELSRFNDSSQTWTPVFANTIEEDEEKITFAAPVAGLSQYGTSFWSVSTSSESVAGAQLSIDQIDTSPAGNGQVHVQATVTNRSPQAVSRDLSLIIDGIPAYSTTVEVDSQSVVIVETDVFMKPGMRNLSLGNHNTSYENLLVAGSSGDSGADSSISGSDLASMGADCPSESEVPDNEIHYDSEIESTIDCAGDIDQWVFEGRTGDLVTIQMKAGPGSQLDAAIDLVSPNDKLVKSDDDSTESSNPPANGIDSEITSYELRFNGMYSILSKGGGTGGYNLVVMTTDNSTPDAPAQPVLSAADDSGDSNSDGITKKENNLSFDIERISNLGAKPHIRLWRGNDIEIGACSADEYDGTCTVVVNELSEGEHYIYATAINEMGTSSSRSDSVVITIDTEIEAPSEPDLTIGSDSGKETDDDLTSQDSPTFSGTGEPYARVEIINSVSAVLGTDMVASTGLWKVTADEQSLEDGTHLIFARVIDDAGNQSDLSDSLEVTVDTEAPDRMDQPQPNQNGEVSGRLEPDLLITLYNRGEEVSTVETQDTGSWFFSMNELPNGQNSLTVTATDAAGNESEQSPENQISMQGQGQFQQGQGQGPNEAPIIDAMFGNNPNNNNWENTRDTDDSFPEFRGWGEPFMDVTLRSNGNRLGDDTVKADGSWIVYPDREMREGNHLITAELVDPNTGRVGPLSDPYAIDIHPAGSGNVMIPTTPQMYWNDASGRQMSGSETAASHDVWFEGYADSGVAIFLMDDMEQIGDTYTNQNGQWSIYPYEDLTPGRYYLNAYSENDYGMQSSWSQTAEIYVTSATADLKPPVIEGLLYYDSYGNTILTDSVVTGYVGFQGYNGAPDMELRVYANGEEIAHAQVHPDGRWEAWSNFMLKPGGYALTAIASDWNFNMEVESEPFWVEITAVEPPIVYGVRDQWGDWSTIHDASIIGPMMIGGGAKPNMRIEVFVDGQWIADSGTDANMDTWEIRPTPEACFPQGIYKVTAYGYANGDMQSEESDPVYIEVIGDGKAMCDMMGNMIQSGSMFQDGSMGGNDMFGSNSGPNQGGSGFNNSGPNQGGGGFNSGGSSGSSSGGYNSGDGNFSGGNSGGGNFSGGNSGGGNFSGGNSGGGNYSGNN